LAKSSNFMVIENISRVLYFIKKVRELLMRGNIRIARLFTEI